MAPKASNRPQQKKPKVLEGLDVPSLAKYIKSERCKNIVLMLGAGISTSAGIPDFRSPKTGLYSNLARLNLPHPEAVFEIGFFQRNPVPFYTLAHELYPGKFRPTVTHSFVRLLHEKSKLHTCFTQNIDTLERRAGVLDDKIIEAHGSFATQRCIKCKREFDDDKMREHILAKKIAKCEACGGYVKPDIVFFGEALPERFIENVPNVQFADLLIVMGTSLTVHPFASLAWMTSETCPRVLINLERVGDMGTKSDDLILLGQCDDYVRKLCKELGWLEELERLWEETKETVITDHLEPTQKTEEKEEKKTQKEEKKVAKDEKKQKAKEEKASKEKPELEIPAQADETLDEINKGLAHLAINPEKESSSASKEQPAGNNMGAVDSAAPSKEAPSKVALDKEKAILLEVKAEPGQGSSSSDGPKDASTTEQKL